MTKFPRTEVQSFVNRRENPWISKVSSISKWLNTNTYRGRRVSRLCLGLSRESNTSTGFQVMIFIPPARWASRRMIEGERKPYGRRGTRFKRGHEKKTSRSGEKWEFFFPPSIRRIYSWFKLYWKGGNGSGEQLVAIEEVDGTIEYNKSWQVSRVGGVRVLVFIDGVINSFERLVTLFVD